MENYVHDQAKPFLAELADLMEKHGVEISSNASAHDDSGLQSWLEIDEIIVSDHGRRTCKEVARFDYLNPLEIRNVYKTSNS